MTFKLASICLAFFLVELIELLLTEIYLFSEC